MFRIFKAILDGLKRFKDKVVEWWNGPGGESVREVAVGVVKEAVKLVPATLIGIFTAYHFPVFLAAIASIPVMRWVVDRWDLPPTAKVAIQLSVVFLLDVLFAYFPFITIVLGILAVYLDVDLVISKIMAAYTKIEQGVLKAIGEADDVSPTTVPC